MDNLIHQILINLYLKNILPMLHRKISQKMSHGVKFKQENKIK